MNQSRGGAIAILLAFAAFIVALLAWLAPFSPIGPSPFAPDNTEHTAAPSFTPIAEHASVLLPQAGDIRVVMRGGVEVEQVFVPAGSFMMGSEDGEENERPVHEVTLDAFWIDRMEVTNAQYAAFVTETGYITTAESVGDGWTMDESGEWFPFEGANWQHPRGPGSDLDGLSDHPVVLVSWEDAAAYAEWTGGRLPTEAEWEYVARGSENRVYPWGDTFDGRRLNFCDLNCPSDHADKNVDDGYAFTAPTGTYPDGASWVGTLDMAGNVWEWASDRYDDQYYQNSPAINPTGPASGEAKALRGGAWDRSGQDARASYRDSSYLRLSSSDIGFRVIEPLSDPDS